MNPNNGSRVGPHSDVTRLTINRSPTFPLFDSTKSSKSKHVVTLRPTWNKKKKLEKN